MHRIGFVVYAAPFLRIDVLNGHQYQQRALECFRDKAVLQRPGIIACANRPQCARPGKPLVHCLLCRDVQVSNRILLEQVAELDVGEPLAIDAEMPFGRPVRNQHSIFIGRDQEMRQGVSCNAGCQSVQCRLLENSERSFRLRLLGRCHGLLLACTGDGGRSGRYY